MRNTSTIENILKVIGLFIVAIFLFNLVFGLIGGLLWFAIKVALPIAIVVWVIRWLTTPKSSHRNY